METLYPAIEPYNTIRFEADDIHRIYVEECGNRSGIPVIFLHGGPASGCRPDHRRFFNPDRYRIILFDQRGSGRSNPFGELNKNTTQDLIEDIENIRIKLGIDQWLLFGGSWGGTLALLYAQKYPENVTGMILRGTFLARAQDQDWFVKCGANRIYPEQWAKLVSSIPESESHDIIRAIDKRMCGSDEVAQLRMAREWDAWGGLVALGQDFSYNALEEQDSASLIRRVKIEMHYAKHHYFLEEDQILDYCDRIRDTPISIIHGRNDLVCPVESSFILSKRLPKAELHVLPNAGHVAKGEEMIDALITATDRMSDRRI